MKKQQHQGAEGELVVSAPLFNGK